MLLLSSIRFLLQGTCRKRVVGIGRQVLEGVLLLVLISAKHAVVNGGKWIVEFGNFMEVRCGLESNGRLFDLIQ